MKCVKEYYIAIIVMIGCVIVSMILLGTLFIGGTNGIKYRSTHPGNFTSPLIKHLLTFIGEKSGFATHHHIDNFLFGFLFTSSIIFFPYFFIHQLLKGENVKLKPSIKVYLYFIFLLCQVSFAAFWEVLEKVVIWVGGTIFIIYPKIKYLEPYISGQEHYMNSWLSDITQAITTSIIVILFIVFDIVKPASYNLYNRKFYMLVIRFILYAASASTCLLTFVIKVYANIDYRFKIGFYIHICWRIFFMMALYIDDLRNLKNDDKFKKNKREINKFWIMIIGYLIIEYISTFDLNVWGLISSNVSAILYLGILIIIKFSNLF